MALQQCLALMYATTGDQRCTGVGTGSTQVTLSTLPTVWTGDSPTQIVMPGEELQANVCRNASNGIAHLCFQSDGNLVIYNQYWQPRWSINQQGTGRKCFFQIEGNLVVYDAAGNAVWASSTGGNPGVQLVVKNDGSVAYYNINGKQVTAIVGPDPAGPPPPA